jgi:hypothetical protein
VTDIPYDNEQLEKYQTRLILAIQEKIVKARRGYDTSRPLILASYANEYISIYLKQRTLESLVSRNEQFFDEMAPFNEVVFWSLPSGGVFQVKPGIRAV